MNIKSDEAHQLARTLAEATGENLTTAVTVALRERLERVTAEPEDHLADRLVAIGEACASRLPDSVRHVDHGDLLYDEHGLPR